MTRLNAKGYTMVELLIAMTIFSGMLLLVATSFLGIIRIQQAGIAARAVQQNNRLILDQMIATARTSNVLTTAADTNDPTGTSNRVCFTTAKGIIEYGLDANLDIHQMTTGALADCSVPVDVGSGQILNDNSVKIEHLVVTSTPPLAASLGTVTVSLTTAANSNLDTLNAAHTACVKGPGSQYCSLTTAFSTAELKTGNTDAP